MTSRPLLATGGALLGLGLWSLLLEGASCTEVGDRVPVLWVLAGVAAAGEAWAAARRGGGAVSVVLWLLGTGAVMVVIAVLVGLITSSGAGCLD